MPQWQKLNYRLPWSNRQILTAWLELNFSPSLSKLDFNCLSLRQTTQLSAFMAQSQLPILFFKIFKFSGPSLLGMPSFTLQPISCLGFIITIVVVIYFARERKLYPMLCTWTKSRIDQSQIWGCPLWCNG